MSPAGPSSLGEPGVLAPAQISLVRAHLEIILASHTFAGSRRTQDFLRLIVGHALEGDIDNLRERMIGAEMFGRPVSYDTGSDSVVRVRASEVRKKLAQFYSEIGHAKPEVRIELPSGSYVPRFHFEVSREPATSAVSNPVNSQLQQAHQADAVAASDAGVQSPPVRSRVKRIITPPILAGAIFSLCLIALAGSWTVKKWMNGSGSPKGIHSIAILPLENLSGSPDQNYFADGMTEELINDLGQVSTLRVISLTSSMSYKGTRKTLPEIAHELSVDGVVEGGVLREGNQVRVSVQLIDARNDRPIWAHTYVRDLSGVSSWQGEVAQAIADEVSSDVTPQQQAQLTRKSSVDPIAQDDYLRGILLRENDDCKNAIADFNRAIDKDPSYAQAHSALASCYGMLGESGRMQYEQAFELQKSEALKAIALDDFLSEAHAELANTAMTLDWDWPVAEAEFHRALALNPNSATNHEKYAFYLVRTGHPNEALAEIQRSVDLDPVSGSTFHAEGFVYYFSHQYFRALDVARTVRGLKINLSDWNLLTGASYAEKGMYNDAIQAFLKSGNGAYSLGHLGNAYARAGRKQAAQKLISELEEDVRTEGVGRYEIALVYAGLGDSRNAFKWLDDAYRAHDVGLVYLNVDPCLDSLRADPRFEDLVRRVGLAK
jgi:TolB-like protein